MDIQIMTSMFEKSRSENKGLTLFLRGAQSIALVVTAVHGTHTLEGRNQQYSKIAVRIDQITALAFQ